MKEELTVRHDKEKYKELIERQKKSIKCFAKENRKLLKELMETRRELIHAKATIRKQNKIIERLQNE